VAVLERQLQRLHQSLPPGRIGFDPVLNHGQDSGNGRADVGETLTLQQITDFRFRRARRNRDREGNREFCGWRGLGVQKVGDAGGRGDRGRS